MKSMLVLLMAVTIPWPTLASEAWPHLDRTSMAADAFTRDHPEWDGRGVAIAVVDSGVDVGVPGLLTTSTGEVKVLDARDFTGQGDISLTRATWYDGKATHPDDEWSLDGLEAAGVPEGHLDVLLGLIEEVQFAGSRAQDLDGDGEPTGRWAVVAYRLEDQWWLRVDTDGDGDVSDEDALQDYGDTQRAFTLSGDPLTADTVATPLHFAPTLLADQDLLSLHFDDGGHGTHVAGIAAGHAIGGVQGQDGVAPGAWVLSLKIGHNQLPGGATVTGSMRKAFEYGAQWSEEHGIPVVFNLSYGISSGIEGAGGMEKFLDELLVDHPHLVVVTSNGNEGPGLSTTGIPAAAENVISVGSYITRELAVNLRGRDIGADRVVFYSSRGGETPKPDVVAPGLAFSTVAPWDERPVKSGTSMASPAAAGAVALLLSAASAQDLEPTWAQVRRALWASATRVPGYGHLDQGWGLVQVPAAWRALQTLVRDRGVQPLTFHVEAKGPVPPDFGGRNAYWRAGGYVPEGRKGQQFHVTPVFASDVAADDRVAPTVDVTLRSDASWLKVDRPRLQFQGEQRKSLSLRFDPGKLRQPGAHVARVTGTPVGDAAAAFQIMAVVIVPERFDGGQVRTWPNIQLGPGDVYRLFLEVPAGATAMEARIEVPEGRDGKFWTELYDPIGDPEGRRQGRADSERDRELIIRVDRGDLVPGTWELDLTGAHDAVTASRGDVQVLFFGLAATPDLVDGFDGGADEPASGVLSVVNVFGEPFAGKAQGAVDRLQRTSDQEADAEGWSKSFELTADRPRAEFHFLMELADYGQLTDCALRILDSDGEPVQRGWVGPGGGHIAVDGAGEYTVEMVSAHNEISPAESLAFELEERYFLAHPASIAVTGDDGGDLHLYPGLAADLDLELAGVLPHTQDGFVAAGEITFVSGRDDSEWLVVPVRVP
jgi:tripeptidyl-peptidase II